MRGAALALALLVGVVAWLATRDGGTEPAAPAATDEARIVAEEELADFAATAGYPVYWAGPPAAGGQLELTELSGGGALVRYLEEGEEPGASPAGRVAIGSYPLADPGGAVRSIAGRPGAIERRLPGVGEVVASPREGTSAYFADPTNAVQVEVYAPTLARALGLLRSGRVRPVA